MFSKVLVGIDGGSGGRDALALGRRLAAPGAALVLGYVWGSADGVIAAMTGAPHPAATGHELLQAELLAADVTCSTDVRPASSTAAGLHEMAEELGCDLLVVGSPERQVGGHGLMGGHARLALHAAPCAVAVSPRGYAATDRAMTNVGVGYQETAAGDVALQTARRIALTFGAGLDVLSVVAPMPSRWTNEPYALLVELDALLDIRVKEAQARLEALEGCTVFVRRGEPVDRLLEFSKDVSLLVLGSRGYGPVRRMLLGSTSNAVVQDASCPVLVLTRPLLDEPARRANAAVERPAATRTAGA